MLGLILPLFIIAGADTIEQRTPPVEVNIVEALPAGKYNLTCGVKQVSYQTPLGNVEVTCDWNPIVDDLIVDNTYPACRFTGSWAKLVMPKGFHGADYRSSSTPGSTATWTLDVPHEGHYEVLVFNGVAKATAKAAPYTIHHAGGVWNAVADQTQIGWLSFGGYHLKPNGGHKIVLTVPPGASVTADAVKLIYEGPID